MEKLSYPLFLRNWNGLYAEFNHHYDYFKGLSSLVENSCICSEEKEFQNLIESSDDVIEALDDLLSKLDWYRHCAHEAYFESPQGLDL